MSRFSCLSLALLPLAGSLACGKAPPPANPEFNDALVYAFQSFEGEEVDLAFAVRALEEQVYLGMDVEADSVQDRALTQADLTEADVADVDHPGRDPRDCLPVAVAGLSAWPPSDHARIQMLSDQTPVEPYSPNHYDRRFLEGQDCWEGIDCPVMRTENDLTKDNILMTISYILMKDFRWVDLGLPDPAAVPEGEEAVNDGEPRWAIVGRSWMPEAAVGDGGDNTIHQSFSLEIWLPRDGGAQGDAAGLSGGGGGLRMLALWTETELGGLDLSDDAVAATTRGGIDDIFQAAEDWLEDHPG